jgi:parallel beta-helix repeat protein
MIQRYGCIAALLAALAPCSTASAADYCVNTTAELQAALTEAAFSVEDDWVRLESGSYDISGGLVYVGSPLGSGNLRMLGSYDVGCGNRSGDAGDTLLFGGGSQDATLRFVALRDTLEVDAMTLFETGKVAVSTVECSSGGFGVTLRRMRLIGTTVAPVSSGARNGALNLELYCASARLENVQITASDREGLYLMLGPERGVDMIHATIADNGAGGLRWANQDADGNLVRIRNSLLWSNDDYDIQTQFAVSVANSTFTTVLGNGSATGAGNSSSNPQLTFNYSLTEPGSPAINSASLTVPGALPATDVLGNPRVIGGLPDRGARESSVDGSTTLTVTTTNDSGTGSLRSAITNANNTAGLQRIEFDIPGSCPRTITPATPLPVITDDVEIDGYTQAGSVPNNADQSFNAEICVILQQPVSPSMDGLHISTDLTEPVAIRGLAFSRFGEAAILVVSGAGHQIEGNQFAGAAGAGNVDLIDNGTNIRVLDFARDVTIGGFSDEQRNLISGAFLYGVHIDGATEVAVLDNLIGTNASGNAALGNGYGVFIAQAANNHVLGNVISGNGVFGVWVYGAESDGNQILGNRIGLRASTGACIACSVPNGNSGVLIERASADAAFDGPSDTDILDNTIAYNGGDGVSVLNGKRNTVRGTIRDNAGLGIDLGSNGPSPNDDDSAVNASLLANRGLNAPELTAAFEENGVYQVQGTMASTAGAYTLTFYSTLTCDASGYGEGARLIGARNLGLLGSGQVSASFTATLDDGISLAAHEITAVARDADGNSSEFSACIPFEAGLIFRDGFE